MQLGEWYSRFKRGSAGLAIVTLAAGGFFKLAAFAREAFIASRFGLSPVTDAYFAFQQFPAILATFMFGAFGLAFTPAYAAEKRRSGSVDWLPGLLAYGCVAGFLMTAMLTILAPQILHLLTAPSAEAQTTLVLLSWAFAPVICLGVWTGVALAQGRNLRVMFVSGLPYLIMTLLLVGLYLAGRLNGLSLPVSFLAGFGVLGIFACAHLVVEECQGTTFSGLLTAYRADGFRAFFRQLGASSLENLGFAANQLLIVYCVAQTGAGSVSANTCAMRVGMFGLSLIGLPLAQLVQGKLCAAQESERRKLFRQWFLAVGGLVCLFAVALSVLRFPLIRLVYLHGNFSQAEMLRVAEVMPAWIGYFLVTSLNTLVSRYLFTEGQGSVYLRRQLSAYAVANIARLMLFGRLTSAGVIWCSVVAEGLALLWSVRTTLATPAQSEIEPVLTQAQEVGL